MLRLFDVNAFNYPSSLKCFPNSTIVTDIHPLPQITGWNIAVKHVIDVPGGYAALNSLYILGGSKAT
jgi:hypothetical protein